MKPIRSDIDQWVQTVRICGILLLVLLAGPGSVVRGQIVGSDTVANSPHNLSAQGSSTVKAASETEICVFCHTPHNATPVQPLWNRALPVSAYKTYTSNSLKALPGQPTGQSKLCLSCHDGTIALGSVNSRTQPIQMVGGITTLPPGKSNLGTDLSDDHPISFVYDATLVSKNPKLVDPSLLPLTVRLDVDKNLQCTSCHDAHNDRNGNFLVMSNQNSELCNTCHTMGRTPVTQHVNCNSCHQAHTAPSGPYLLTQAKVSDTCLTCHSGVVGTNQGLNIATTLATPYAHDTKSQVNLTDHIPNNSDCKDCHESHTMALGGSVSVAPALQPTLGKIDGVSVTGAALTNAQNEYEVCFKCHADQTATVTTISRALVQGNMRMMMAPTAVSYHPVAARGVNTDVPSLRPPYTTDSIIYCTDCHGSDSSKKAGGTGANGPHGSSFPGLLVAQYRTTDQTAYTTTAYALCFNCHDNTKVVANTGPFPKHLSHVQGDQAPCSACHDSHGVSSAQGSTITNYGLINFDTSIVLPDDVTHTINFTHTGSEHGTCTLKCHGVNHSATTTTY